MELRRPRLADKETVLEMMTEFEKSQSAHDGGFGIQRTLCMKNGWKQISKRNGNKLA